MTSLYSRFAGTRHGARALSEARLRYSVLHVLGVAMKRGGLTQTHLAERLGRRKSAVNQVVKGDGNVRISTLAEYLHEAGFELELRLVPVGRLREDAIREMNVVRLGVTGQANPHTGAPLDLDALEWRGGMQRATHVLVRSEKRPATP